MKINTKQKQKGSTNEMEGIETTEQRRSVTQHESYNYEHYHIRPDVSIHEINQQINNSKDNTYEAINSSNQYNGHSYQKI